MEYNRSQSQSQTTRDECGYERGDERRDNCIEDRKQSAEKSRREFNRSSTAATLSEKFDAELEAAHLVLEKCWEQLENNYGDTISVTAGEVYPQNSSIAVQNDVSVVLNKLSQNDSDVGFHVEEHRSGDKTAPRQWLVSEE